MKKAGVILFASALCISVSVQADVIDQRLAQYTKEGASGFSADTGKQMWEKKYPDAETGKDRSCTTCHGTDLKVAGKHQKTGKVIDPLAPSVNKERFTDEKKIEKWFKRNCEWTIGRECTPKEKGDFLLFLRAQ